MFLAANSIGIVEPGGHRRMLVNRIASIEFVCRVRRCGYESLYFVCDLWVVVPRAGWLLPRHLGPSSRIPRQTPCPSPPRISGHLPLTPPSGSIVWNWAAAVSSASLISATIHLRHSSRRLPPPRTPTPIRPNGITYGAMPLASPSPPFPNLAPRRCCSRGRSCSGRNG